MQILVPISSDSNFFPRNEFFFPKPLIEVGGELMISRVVSNLKPYFKNLKFIFVIDNEDATKFSLDKTLSILIGGDVKIIEKNNETKGATCSALLAVDDIDLDEPIIVVNSDQIIEKNISVITDFFSNNNASAGVITFPSVHPRWSYAVVDDGLVLQTAEKMVVSNKAIAGFYFFKDGRTFVEAAKKSILNCASIDGKFFLSGVVNEVILLGGIVKSFAIDASQYHSFYSPAKILEFENQLLNRGDNVASWGITDGINLVVPAAGMGSRFAAQGWKAPKPFIDVDGKPMIARVLDNVGGKNSKSTVIVQKALLSSRPDHANILTEVADNLIALENLTEGTAATILFARKHIDNSMPLLIANSDQVVDFDVSDFVNDCHERNLDGSILVFRDRNKDPKWSFAKIDDDGLVTEVAEKLPISEWATVGIYYFAKGKDFVAAAIDMIVANNRVNGEFYTCPVYNYMIRDGAKIGVYEVSHEAMNGLGTPEDLNAYLESIGAPESADRPITL